MNNNLWQFQISLVILPVEKNYLIITTHVHTKTHRHTHIHTSNQKPLIIYITVIFVWFVYN